MTAIRRLFTSSAGLLFEALVVMLVVVVMMVGFVAGAHSQIFYRTLSSTPDNTVSATSTKDFSLRPFVPNGTDWIAIKNDCTDTLYFNLSPTTRAALNYPLRLDAGQSFSGPFRVYTVAASNDNASSCTFSLQIGVISR